MVSRNDSPLPRHDDASPHFPRPNPRIGLLRAFSGRLAYDLNDYPDENL